MRQVFHGNCTLLLYYILPFHDFSFNLDGDLVKILDTQIVASGDLDNSQHHMDGVGRSSPNTFLLSPISMKIYASRDPFLTCFRISPDAFVRREIPIFL